MLRREQIAKERQKTESKIPQIESQILQRVFHKIQKAKFDGSGTNTDWKQHFSVDERFLLKTFV